MGIVVVHHEGTGHDTVKWVTVDEPALGLTVQAPEGWSQRRTEVFPLQLLAPSEGGYRTSVSFSRERIDPPTEEGFRDWVERAVEARRRAAGDTWTELGRGMVAVGGRAGAGAQYRRHMGAIGRDIEQMIVAVPLATDLLLEIDASAAAEGDEPLAVARQVITTITFPG